MTITYPQRFKLEMVEKMLPPNAQSASYLARRSGIAQSTLSKWLRDAKSDSLLSMKIKNKNKTKRNKDHQNDPVKKLASGGNKKMLSLEDKLQIVLEAGRLDSNDLGAFLRTHGLHESDLAQYQEDVQIALSEVKEFGRKENRYKKDLNKIEKELRRKEKALAEAAALLVLKKKVQAIWGDEDNDIAKKNDN
jgi:transposase